MKRREQLLSPFLRLYSLTGTNTDSASGRTQQIMINRPNKLLAGIVICICMLLAAFSLALPNWDCGIGDGHMIDGGGAWSFTTCRSGSDWLGRSTETYPNAAWANRVFDERVHKAITVIEQNEKVDGEDRSVGKRAVAIFAEPSLSKPINSIFWVDDRSIISVSSTSLDFALYAERSK